MNDLLEQKQKIDIFEELIAPISIEEFHKNYWEKKPLIVKRKDQDYFGSFLEQEWHLDIMFYKIYYDE